MLEVKDVCAGYGDLPVLFGVSMKVTEGEIISLIGSNGAGKSSLINVITGILRATSGTVTFMGERIDALTAHEIVKRGISHIPEGKHIFFNMTVLENLKMGAYIQREKREAKETLDWVFSLFPILRERQRQRGGTLSGGEQQMLAIGRGLAARPKIVIFDEPSLGLMPKLLPKIYGVVEEINRKGVTIILVEQNVREALRLAQRAYVLQTGKIVLEGKGMELLESPLVRKAYLGL
jgi:branched-chain amino acid transport system ATP-binding protein